MAGAEIAIVAIPSEFCRPAYRALRPHLAPEAVLVSATKGLEIDTLRRMSEVASEEAPGHPVAVLSGPSFALEVAHGQPTTVVVASPDAAVAERVQRAVSSRTFRAYSSDDVTGVELGGALKNIIAIAAGIVDGLGYGHNTAAALITRGLAEITRLAVARGARPDTLSGLAGLGDLVLTCTGTLSRNRRLGQALGSGRDLGSGAGRAAHGRGRGPHHAGRLRPGRRGVGGDADRAADARRPLRRQAAPCGGGRADVAHPEKGVNYDAASRPSGRHRRT